MQILPNIYLKLVKIVLVNRIEMTLSIEWFSVPSSKYGAQLINRLQSFWASETIDRKVNIQG